MHLKYVPLLLVASISLVSMAGAQRGSRRGPIVANMTQCQAICPVGGDQIVGMIKSIDTRAGVMVVESAGRDARIAVNASTIYKSGPTAASYSDLKVGLPICACGEMANGQLNAVMVNLRFQGRNGMLCSGVGQGQGYGRANMINGRMQGRGPGRGMCLSGPSAGICYFGQQICGNIVRINASQRVFVIDTGTGQIDVRTDDDTIIKSGPDITSFNSLKLGQSVCCGGSQAGTTLDARMVNIRFRGR